MREKPYRCRRHAEGISGQRREKTERIHPAESREPLIEAEAVSLSYDGGAASERYPFQNRAGSPVLSHGSQRMRKEYADQLYSGDARTGQRRDSDRRQTGFEYRPKELAKRVAFVPQVHERTFSYTVEQVVLMGRNAYSRALSGPEASDRKMVKEVLERTGIAHCRSVRILVSAEERCSW